MKFLSPFFLLLRCIGLLITACEKENFVITGFGCNQLLFPATVLTSEGELVTVNNEDEYAHLILGRTSVDL